MSILCRKIGFEFLRKKKETKTNLVWLNFDASRYIHIQIRRKAYHMIHISRLIMIVIYVYMYMKISKR